MTTRRHIAFATVAPAALAALGARAASAQPAKQRESDQAAVSLGYMHDASKVDKAKDPTFASGHECSNSQLFQGKASEQWAACPAVGDKRVDAKGGCVARVKTA
jgi:hypothetical protein